MDTQAVADACASGHIAGAQIFNTTIFIYGFACSRDSTLSVFHLMTFWLVSSPILQSLPSLIFVFIEYRIK